MILAPNRLLVIPWVLVSLRVCSSVCLVRLVRVCPCLVVVCPPIPVRHSVIPCLYVMVRPDVCIFNVSIVVSNVVGTSVNTGSKRSVNV